MDQTKYPIGWRFSKDRCVHKLSPGMRFPIPIGTYTDKCRNCGDLDGYMYSRVILANDPKKSIFTDGHGHEIFLPSSLESAPCPHCNSSVQVRWLVLKSGMSDMKLEGKIALDLRLHKFKPRHDQKQALDVTNSLLQEIPDPKSNGLFFGGNGVGKTHILMGLANAYRVASVWVHYTTAENVLEQIRSSYGEFEDSNIRGELENCTVLILDEFDKIKWTEWAGEKLFGILENRHLSGRPTLLASNMPPSTLQNKHEYVPSILSRISTGFVVGIHGEDFRPNLPYKD